MAEVAIIGSCFQNGLLLGEILVDNLPAPKVNKVGNTSAFRQQQF